MSLSIGSYVQLKGDPSIRGIVKKNDALTKSSLFSTTIIVELSEPLICTCGHCPEPEMTELPGVSTAWEEVPN